MRRDMGFYLPFLAIPLLVACGTPCAPDGVLPLLDAGNYTFSGALHVARVPVAEGADVEVSWGGLTTDLQGHAMDPSTTVQSAQIVLFRYLTEDEVEQGMAEDTLEQADVGLYAFAQTGGATSLHLSDLAVLSYAFDPPANFLERNGTWLFLLSDGANPGQGVRKATFLQPRATGTATSAVVDDASTTLDVQVDLDALQPLDVPVDTPDLVLDWTALATDGRGNPLELEDVDQVLVARYDDLGASDLEARFLDLELIAAATWYAEVTGATTLPLTALSGAEGAFPGFDDASTWVVALRCTTCANPAPPFLTLVAPCP